MKCKAAQELYITPQGLSKVLKKLETELQLILFDRDRSGLKPTYAAKKLYEEVDRLAEILNKISSGKIDTSDEKKTLRVSIASGVVDYLTIHMFEKFREKYPQIKLEIRQNTDIDVEKDVKDSRFDLGIICGLADLSKYRMDYIYSLKHCIVLNKNHPLAQKNIITYQDLDGEALVMVDEHSKACEINLGRFAKAGISPNIMVGTINYEQLSFIAHMDWGMGLSVENVAWRNLYPNVVIRPLDDKTCTLDVYFISRKDEELSEAAMLFIEFTKIWITENRDKLFQWPEKGRLP